MKKLTLVLAALVAAAAALTGCSTPEDDRQVSIVLDWTPNTNHTGIYVAEALGYYDEANIDVEVLGYSQAGVESVMSTGEAEFGFSGVDSLASAHASGMDLSMVINVQQTGSFGVAVRADSDIWRPRDLDGKTIADYGAGATNYNTTLMIQNDGGRGEFERIIVGTGALDAVVAGRADFAEEMATWGVIAQELQGHEIRMFHPEDYNVPTTPANLGISVRDDFADQNPDVVRDFVAATVRGYEYAIDNPDEAAKILVEANEDANIDPELARRSQELLSANHWTDEQGRFGYADIERWQNYLDHLVAAGLVVDNTGEALTENVDANELVTNEFLP